MNEAAPTPQRGAILAACANLLQACGLTLQELADYTGAALAVPSIARLAPAPDGGPALSGNAQTALQMADRDDGVLAVEVQARLGCVQSNAQAMCQILLDRGLLHRVKNAGSSAYRYFRTAAQAQAYDEARGQLGRAIVALAAPLPEPAAPAPVVAPAAAKRFVRKPPGKPGAELAVKGGTASPAAPAPKAAREPIFTDATVRTIDETKRPSSRIEAARALPPDPRWPSFSATPLGVNPDTGRPWA